MDKRNKLILVLGGVGILSTLLFFSFPSHKVGSDSANSMVTSPAPVVAPISDKAIPAATVLPLSEEEQTKLLTLDEILKSKNDNDPRIDHDYRHLSASMKNALIKRYQAFPREDRNGRGLIVFLVSRELSSLEDIHFLQSVYEEAPCTNMDGCSAAPSNDPHHSGIENTSLNYPQLVGLYQIEKVLKDNPQLLSNPALKVALIDLLNKAKLFPVQIVQNRAAGISALLANP